MSENVISVFGLMGREGPCFHCGIAYTPLWRNGPTEKPVLCNACGSRWRTRGTLEDYIPKHAHINPNLEEPPRSLSYVQPSQTLGQVLDNVARKRRSILEHHVLSPTERFYQQLRNALHDPQFAKELHDEAEHVLIIERANHYIPENEVGVGCALIKQPPQS